ncbi:MAG: hypothetical protein E4H09_00120 [Spirochaetales bacterium]|nr:MAG: hypothetical protein E4H09_00120 [Spirochaetales bacterium]
MRWLKKNWFLVGLLGTLLLASIFAQFGARLNPGGWTNRTIVIVLFLITGLTLPSDRIIQDLATPRLHVLIQLFIFVLAPAYFLTAGLFFKDVLDGQLLIGIYALAVLPTTVSTCIVFTQSSGGNATGAVFNAALANTAGIFLSPLLLSLILSSTGRALPMEQLLSTIRSLALNMLVPIVVGQLLRLWIKTWATTNRKRLGIISNSLILGVVFLAFAKTAANPDFTRYLSALPGPVLYLAVSHILLVVLGILLGRALRLSPADRVTAMFVAPQKTLALGAPLLTIFFAGQDILGVALLPLVFYHPF